MIAITSRLTASAKLFLVGLALSWVLVVLIIMRYPGDKSSLAAHVWYGGIATVPLSTMAVGVAFLGVHDQTPLNRADAKTGIIVGLLAGFGWMIEISFNNFVDPVVSTPSARFIVDNGVWGIVAMLIVFTSCARALRAQRFVSAVRVGLWGGSISGLISCLMGLLLVTVGMQCLLRDPLNVQEYALRGAPEHASDMATYFAYDTLAGALGHLLILGLAMGVLLGAVGGLIARLLGSVMRRLEHGARLDTKLSLPRSRRAPSPDRSRTSL